MEVLEWLIDQFPTLSDYLPSGINDVIATVMSLCTMADHFVPFSESCALIAFVVAFLLGFIAFKFVLKLIPGIG